uniref:Putative larval/pupal cuticle protein h1c n=1 Tax=Corethrella appendiculata TaxID=1370023 RepID=U5EXS4_9DIPT
MAFKIVVLCASLAFANAGLIGAPALAHTSYISSPTYTSYHSPAIGSTHESVVRSHGGTVSHYGKAVDTLHSSVRKSDTRITNDGLKVATYAAPAVATYAHAAPAVATYSHAAPAVATYAHAAPAIVAHSAPVLATASKTLTYSPAVAVAHTTYEDAHAHYAW